MKVLLQFLSVDLWWELGLFFTKKEQGTDRKETMLWSITKARKVSHEIYVPRTWHSLIWKNLHKKLQEKKEEEEEVEEMGFELVAGIDDVMWEEQEQRNE